MFQETLPIDDLKHGCSLPKATVLGNPFKKERKIVVCAEEELLHTSNSTTEALPVTFALYFILNFEYPKEVKHTLSFIQHHVLNIKTASGKLSAKVINVVEKLSSLKSKNVVSCELK